MKRNVARALFWAPRLLGLGIAGFLGLFAFDVFEDGLGFWMTAGVFLIHLVPSAAVIGAVVAAWRRAWLGAVVFGVLGAVYLFLGAGRVHWLAFAMISGPLFLTGVLFLLEALSRGQQAA